MGALCLALVLAGLTLPSASWAGDIFNFRGSTAGSAFNSTDPTGCINTDLFVFATEGRLSDPPGPPTASSVASVSIFQYDYCTGAEVLNAGGEATLTAQAFQVSPQLASATLNATVQVTDFVTGSTFNLEVALTWTGTGTLLQEILHERYHAPYFHFQARFNGTSRDAIASGTVSLGGTNLTPKPSDFAFIASVKSGKVVIE